MRACARPARIVAVGAALATAATVATLPVTASASTTGAVQSITVFLKPGNTALLDRLADHPGKLTTARRAALVKALPSAAAERSVEQTLRAHGFTITGASSWSVSAKAPGGLVSTLFGVASSVTGLLSELPQELHGLVSTAFRNDVGEPAMQPRALGGVDFRNAYSSAALTSSGAAQYGGKYRGARPTIATIQLSGWDRGNLATFAHRKHLPYSSSTLTQVPVNQSSVPTTGANGGPIEVALDQESILSTDPSVHERAYFAPNTDAGYADAFSKVYDDVVGNKHAYHGGDRHITALSVSWGECESQDSSLDTTESIIKSLVAAGVTVFAASGDDGAYDCSNALGMSTEGVDFPASSPYVVGVGGTTLSKNPGGANNGHNWAETAWSCSGSSDCSGGFLGLSSGHGGSGGGVSSNFDKPSYQGSISGSMRMVPDIAAVADPDNGMQMYSTYQSYGWVTVGGTSLAAPVEAALFTNMLAAHGLSHGIGDIHAKLYAAAHASGTFRDITEGTNTYAAGRGYDLVTGLGAPLWPAIGQRIFGASSVKPRITWSTHGHAAKRPVTLHWASGKHGLLVSVTVRSRGGAVVARRFVAAPTSRLSFRGHVGQRYVATVTVTDKSHRISPARKYALVVRR